MRLTPPIRALLALLLIAIPGCGGQPAIRPSAFPSQCDILPVPDQPADSVTVAVFDSFEAGYPWSRTYAERMLTRHCYETLITIDCEGDVRPALALSWNREEGGRRWRVALRPDAAFWDGARVTAYAVEQSWENAMTLDTSIDSVRALNDQVLYVFPEDPTRDIPRVLASPMFAVFKPSSVWHWFDGTGPYTIAAEDRAQRSVTLAPAFGRRRPVITITSAGPDHVRDILERGVDLMVTDDPAGIDYAKNGTRYTTRALDWDRTYVLISTTRVTAARQGHGLEQISPELAASLARDAVRVDARAARAPEWWNAFRECRAGAMKGGGMAFERPRRRILFPASDPVARGLAERIVALAASDPARSRYAEELASVVPGIATDGGRLVAQAASDTELRTSLSRGLEFGYVVAMTRWPSDPCVEARMWWGLAPWMRGGIYLDELVVPLIDVRSHVIAREDRFGLSIDGYGSILVVDERPQGGQLP